MVMVTMTIVAIAATGMGAETRAKGARAAVAAMRGWVGFGAPVVGAAAGRVAVVAVDGADPSGRAGCSSRGISSTSSCNC
jgi:hypothetical protein